MTRGKTEKAPMPENQNKTVEDARDRLLCIMTNTPEVHIKGVAEIVLCHIDRIKYPMSEAGKEIKMLCAIAEGEES